MTWNPNSSHFTDTCLEGGTISKAMNIGLLKNFLESAVYKTNQNKRNNDNSGALQQSVANSPKILETRARFLKRLRRKIDSFTINTGFTNWSDYYAMIIGDIPPWERETDTWTTKELAIQEIMSRLKPETVLDIGANTGWLSLLIAHSGTPVVSFERDEWSINQLYSYLQKENMDVLPLVIDIRQPSPTYELSIGTIPSVAERFRCDLVMALGILHHLVLSQGMSLEHLAYLFDGLTPAYLLVEFVPLNDKWANLPSFTEESWSVDRFKKSFGEYFDFENAWDSHPEGRKLLLFHKRKTAG